MDSVKVLDKSFRLYMENAEILEIIGELAKRINNDYIDRQTPPVVLCVLNGSILFTATLIQQLDFDVILATIRLQSYCGTASTGKIEVTSDVSCDIEGRDVIVMEDIVDTGCTMDFLTAYLREKGAAEVKVCTFLHKPNAFRGKCKLDYVGKCIPNDFIVGFGFDYNGLARHYKDIYVLE